MSKDNLLDDGPETRTKTESFNEPKIDDVVGTRSLKATLFLVAILLLCLFGFSYGLYHVLH